MLISTIIRLTINLIHDIISASVYNCVSTIITCLCQYSDLSLTCYWLTLLHEHIPVEITNKILIRIFKIKI